MKHPITANHTLLYTAITLSAAFTSMPSLASDIALEEVIVTAQKREQSLNDTPITVNVVKGDQMLDFAQYSLSAIENMTAGISLSEYTGFNQDIAVRGLGTKLDAAVDPRVSLYWDGAYIPQIRGVFGAIYDIAQFELLRGPQGTLYGQSSPAGAMTVRSKNPSLEAVEGEIRQTFTEYSGTNTQFGVSIPLIENELGLRIAGLYDKNENSDVRYSALDRNAESKSWSARAVLFWQPSDYFDLRLSHQRNDAKSDLNFVVEGNGVKFDDRISNVDFLNETKNEFQMTVLEMNYEISDQLTLTSVSSHQDSRVQTYQDGDYTSVRGREQFVDSNLPDLYNTELRLASDGNDFWDWNVGLFYYSGKGVTPVEVENYTAIFIPNFIPGGVRANIYAPASTESNIWAVFSHNTFYLSEQSTLTVGLRYQDVQIKQSQPFNVVATALNPDGSEFGPLGAFSYEGILPEDQDITDDAWTGSIKYQYAFSDDLMAFAAYARGWRRGSANIASEIQPPVLGGFGPEESDNFELGIKWSFFENRGQLNAGVYYQLYTDFQYQGPDALFVAPADFREPTGAAAAVTNVDEAEIYGAEIDVNVLLRENLTVGVSLSYNHAELTDAKNVPCSEGALPAGAPEYTFNTCDLSGDRAGPLPEWSGIITGEYWLPLNGNDLEWFARTLVKTESAYYSVDFDEDLDSYTSIDLFSGVRSSSGAWEASIWVKNLFDESARMGLELIDPVPDFNSATGGAVSSGFNLITKQLAPRTIGVSGTYRF